MSRERVSASHPSPRDWDDQYLGGQWDYLRSAAETPRYAAVAGMLSGVGAPGRVVDLGCGEGLLARHLPTDALAGYTGVDFSPAAIAAARRALGASGASFLVSDITRWAPPSALDAVVLNEVLYYLDEPRAFARRCAGWLREHGFLVVSMYRPAWRARAALRWRVRGIWRALRRDFTVDAALDVRAIGAGPAWHIERYSGAVGIEYSTHSARSAPIRS